MMAKRILSHTNIFLGFQSVLVFFLVAALRERWSAIAVSPVSLITLVILLGALLFSFTFLHERSFSRNIIVRRPDHANVMLATIGAAVLTYFLVFQANIGPVMACSFTALIACLFQDGSRKNDLRVMAAYCGSFIGMTSPRMVANMLPYGVSIELCFLIVCAGTAGLALTLMHGRLLRIGGTLGSVAFIGVLTGSLYVSVFSPHARLAGNIPVVFTTGQQALLMVIAIAGACLAQIVGRRMNNFVLASAALTFLVAILFAATPLETLFSVSLAEKIPGLFLGATLVGMTSLRSQIGLRWIAIGGILYAALYVVAPVGFAGLGGVAGVMASIAVCVSLSLKRLVEFKAEAPSIGLKRPARVRIG